MAACAYTALLPALGAVTRTSEDKKTMATILKAPGRMTKDRVTTYEVGQEVVLNAPQFDDPVSRARFQAGDTGVIQKIIISDPNDGDATFSMFRLRFGARTSLVHASEFAPVDEARQ
jgi:hypothetical protein